MAPYGPLTTPTGVSSSQPSLPALTAALRAHDLTLRMQRSWIPRARTAAAGAGGRQRNRGRCSIRRPMLYQQRPRPERETAPWPSPPAASLGTVCTLRYPGARSRPRDAHHPRVAGANLLRGLDCSGPWIQKTSHRPPTGSAGSFARKHALRPRAALRRHCCRREIRRLRLETGSPDVGLAPALRSAVRPVADLTRCRPYRS
jgi:hypothetical protein